MAYDACCLVSLSLSDGVLTPTFDARTHEYTLLVPKDGVETVCITALGSPSTSCIRINDAVDGPFELNLSQYRATRIPIYITLSSASPAVAPAVVTYVIHVADADGATSALTPPGSSSNNCLDANVHPGGAQSESTVPSSAGT